MNKMQKLTCAKVLKVIFYLLGFPLLMLFVAKDSMIFFNEGAFSETAKNGITAALVLWAGFTLLQKTTGCPHNYTRHSCGCAHARPDCGT